MTYQPRLAFTSPNEAGAVHAASEVLELELDGYEGPLHALLDLARRQRIDLRQISISELADQYLAFVRDLASIRLEPVADHLVMAAWLAELKSRVVLPRPARDDAEESAQETTAQLAQRLARLEAIRSRAEALAARPRLGRDVFVRGAPSALAAPPRRIAPGDLHRLIKAYPRSSARTAGGYAPARRIEALGLADARAHLEALASRLVEWTDLVVVAPRRSSRDGPSLASCVASTLAATLELVREGHLRLRQDAAGAPVWLRAPRAHRSEPKELRP